MTFDGRNTIHNRVYVEYLGIAGYSEGPLWNATASKLIDAGFYGMTWVLNLLSL